ncbi:MAG: glycosyltransferase family 2 protein [Bacteroidaceae bacterium]|nr:glycosyltransferase family 2 protein [Bacteroidaceae bacterium]
MLKDGISVIICCYNSGWIISRCLEALKLQKVRDGLLWEILLVDNNCSDDTVGKAAATMTGSAVDFRIVKEPSPGLLNARKRGIEEARYSYTIFCDDDNLLCPVYIDTMYEILSSDSKIGAAGGKGIAEFECEPDIRILKHIRGYAIGSQMGSKEYLFGAGLAIRTDVTRDIYKNQTMYLTGRMRNKLLAGDDTELTMAIQLRGYSLYPTDNISFVHVLRKKRLSWEYYQQMDAGFKRSDPAIMAMRGALMNKSFFHSCVTGYIIAIYLFLRYLILFRKEDASAIRHSNSTRISNFHAWGLGTLKKIHSQWTMIRKSNKTDIISSL